MSKPISNSLQANLPAPVFDDPKHHIRLYQGDCLELLEKIPDNSVELVFADPPYLKYHLAFNLQPGPPREES